MEKGAPGRGFVSSVANGGRGCDGLYSFIRFGYFIASDQDPMHPVKLEILDVMSF
jgi:hypothetical protein